MLQCSSLLNTHSALAEGKLGTDPHPQHMLRVPEPSTRHSTRPDVCHGGWHFVNSYFLVDHPYAAKRPPNGRSTGPCWPLVSVDLPHGPRAVTLGRGSRSSPWRGIDKVDQKWPS